MIECFMLNKTIANVISSLEAKVVKLVEILTHFL